MAERKITVLDDPDTWIGIDAENSGLVCMTLNPGTDHEVRAYFEPLRASFASQQLEMYANHVLAGHAQVIERYESNVEAVTIDRSRPPNLDS